MMAGPEIHVGGSVTVGSAQTDASTAAGGSLSAPVCWSHPALSRLGDKDTGGNKNKSKCRVFSQDLFTVSLTCDITYMSTHRSKPMMPICQVMRKRPKCHAA